MLYRQYKAKHLERVITFFPNTEQGFLLENKPTATCNATKIGFSGGVHLLLLFEIPLSA